MRYILVLTNDDLWRTRIQEYGGDINTQLVFARSLSDPSLTNELKHVDAVLVDASLLPSPDSQEINAVKRLLDGKFVMAVFNPTAPPSLSEVRRSFIAGARDLLAKPYSRLEFSRMMHTP